MSNVFEKNIEQYEWFGKHGFIYVEGDFGRSYSSITEQYWADEDAKINRYDASSYPESIDTGENRAIMENIGLILDSIRVRFCFFALIL